MAEIPKRVKILLVDDNTNRLRELGLGLALHGFLLTTANKSVQLEDQLMQGEYDVILTSQQLSDVVLSWYEEQRFSGREPLFYVIYNSNKSELLQESLKQDYVRFISHNLDHMSIIEELEQALLERGESGIGTELDSQRAEAAFA